MRAWAAAAAIGHLPWLAGNVREARTGAVERWATHPRTSLLARGSPPRYYLTIVPPTLAATVVALGHAGDDERPAVAAATATSATAVAVTAVLVRSVNVPLFHGEQDPSRRALLIRRWHRVNRIRIAVLVVTICGLLTAASRRSVAPRVVSVQWRCGGRP